MRLRPVSRRRPQDERRDHCGTRLHGGTDVDGVGQVGDKGWVVADIRTAVQNDRFDSNHLVEITLQSFL